MHRIASAMAGASLIPEHLQAKCPGIKDLASRASAEMRQTVGNCLLIVNQAVRWNLDPFAVAPETYVVRGKLGFQGKLVAAVINARAGLDGRLSYTFDGSGDGRMITVIGQLKGEQAPRTITLSVGQAKTDNKMWKTDPDQKLVYSGATKWARRHCPEIMLGVLTDDDVERMTAANVRPVANLAELTDRMQEAPEARTDPSTAQTPPQKPQASAPEAQGPPYNPPTPDEQKAAEASQVDPTVDKADGVDPPEPTSEQQEAHWTGELEEVSTLSDLTTVAGFIGADQWLSEKAVGRLDARVMEKRVAIRGKRGVRSND